METGALKSFAVWSRAALIREVSARIAAVLAPGSVERVEQGLTVAALERAIAASGGGDAGRGVVADKVAYIWFNRIVALRYMDANGFTGVGVVSPQAGVVAGQPEVLADAKRGVLDGDVVSQRIGKAVVGLLDGTVPSGDPQGEAYSLLFAEYCRHWNRVMPFMFEHEGDYTELLVPANLLADDSVLSRAVAVMTEDVCRDVEVIGWLYQFYISDRKDEVFAGFKKNKKAGAEEIPAATQLFTPHWIVRYLVENSLGRLWMLNRPASRLVERMDYYIAPVVEEAEFLKITSPEELKVIDPACGSGHMLTYAFDLLYAIYEEEGYSPAEIPGLILANNLYGTEIDQRAGSLAAFALTMKARSRQRTFFNKMSQPNICVIEPISFAQQELDMLLTDDGDRDVEIAFWSQFEHADVLGSLIQPDPEQTDRLGGHLESLKNDGDMLRADVIARAGRATEQAAYLSPRYSVVVANPPYMGQRNMGPALSRFARSSFPRSKADLYAMFIERSQKLGKKHCCVALVTQQSWMFLSTYRSLREFILEGAKIVSLVHLGAGAFDAISGEVVSTTAFVIEDSQVGTGMFVRLLDERDGEAKRKRLAHLARNPEGLWRMSSAELAEVPGAPIAYWLSSEARRSFQLPPISDVAHPRVGMQTADNNRFLRLWWEVSVGEIGRLGDSNPQWIRYLKGGSSRRWAGTIEYVLKYRGDGRAIRATPNGSTISLERAEATKLEWTDISTSGFAVRLADPLAMHDIKSHCFYPDADTLNWVLAYANSTVFRAYLAVLSPGLSNQVGDVGRVPILPFDRAPLAELAREAVAVAREDWSMREVAFEYQGHTRSVAYRLADLVALEVDDSHRRLARLRAIDCAIDEEVGKAAPGGLELSEDLLGGIGENRYDAMSPTGRVEDLLSFAIGCMFGRYSLDEPGLILADQGTTLEDYLAKVPVPTFMPDGDNVIPIVDGDWFEDDIVGRFREFLRVAFGEEHFEENLRFVIDSLGVKDLRDYFVKSFYKDHVQRYKKRPIYWLFSSPKGSFSALIYMHRYTPSTVSTVLNEYLREFQAKLKASLEHAERSNSSKEADRLRKVLLELDEYERDTLYPLASQNIAIDLDDGVKVNYPKFGNALRKIPGLEAKE